MWTDALATRPPMSVVLRNAKESITASELRVNVESLATQLCKYQVLAVLADNSTQWVTADLAAMTAGVLHLPLPTFFTATQMRHVLTQSCADAILTDQVERIEALDMGFKVSWYWCGLSMMQRSTSPANLPIGTAKISFTSGSTGTPKGACLSATGLQATANSIKEKIANLAIKRHLAVLPLTLLLENTAGIYAALLSGAEIYIPSLPTLGWRGMSGFDPSELQKTVATYQPQSLILVPELLKAWVLYLTATRQKAPDGLVFVAVGGARVDPSLLKLARNLGIPAYEGYGLTECGSVVSLNTPGDEGCGVGRPLPHVQLSVQTGEIFASTSAFQGYVGDELARTPPKMAFATGDLGEIDASGHLHLSGRKKNLLITSFGRNISPEWVESVLLAQPTIAQVVVLGDAQACLSAVVVPFASATDTQLRAAVTQANLLLPDYAQIGPWLISEPFTLQNAMATGNGRPVRSTIASHHAAAIAALYNTKDNSHAFL
jgi:long-subunit acyl-CoA synthetase (AMP-forming)